MYVVLEGIDCVGKSTQIELLKPIYKDAIFTSEPGATKLGEHLRELLLNRPYPISSKAELLLFLADRNQHYEEILRENEQKLIISDRSIISGMAYAKNFDLDILFSLNDFALNGFFPQKAIFLRGDENLLKERLMQKNLDDIEKRGIAYFMDVQEKMEKVLNFLKFKIDLKILELDAKDSIENLHKKIKEFIND
ncbi:thymidylate kinase [Campylobacter upsaliensis]|uniref:dTMP kinase n=1 Tax=Campylobacter upsaliensis TaxID=28080 RepID=UPI000E13B7DA|nr:dTMP kinase [Campylobacter upsaliensis]EAI4344163.1 dTMP kinase [Campylobacter upsaliensis]EAI8172630.1 dTMP kinase [Campylobacter upsaliensis]EAJ7107618.1 dTMP kinase [Campylobacter upsaliensis]EAK0965045.1 dTMP kinase [Campylobacter upsaliensis]EAL3832249.1 dTMP kinase [Campylobacter upsaliensis]